MRLFRKKKPALLMRHAGHYGYRVATRTVTFERSGQEIHHFHCECQQRLCAHLAAVMLCLQDRAVVQEAGSRPRKAESAKRSGTKFRAVFGSLETSWKKITACPLPVSEQVSQYVRKLESFAAKGDFHADMAVIAGMSLCGRTAMADESLALITRKIMVRHFTGSRSKSEEEPMFLCLMETLKTNDRALTGRFSSVLPVYLQETRNMFQLEEIRSAIEKRHFRKYHSDLFDELLIARTMVFFRTCELEGKTIKLLRNSPAETFVARARLYFAAGRINDAWKVLDELKGIIRESMPLSYFDLLSYLISLGEVLHDREKQIELSEEMILFSPFLSSAFVSKYLRLIPAAQRPARVRSVMDRVSASGAEGAPDKMLTLAVESGLPDHFLQSPLRHRVRFSLVHELFSRRPQFLEGKGCEYYFSRLCQSLASTDFYHARAQMLDQAAPMLKMFAEKKAESYFLQVREFMATRSKLHGHLHGWDKSAPARMRTLILE